jgi:integrase-like protein/Arm domain-containing DNA-binding protein
VSLKEARRRRDEARVQLAQGIDPSAARKAQKAAQGGEGTLEAVAREWFAKHSPTWAPSHGGRVIRRLERDVFPWLGGCPIAEIAPPDILPLLRRIEARGAGETAHRAVQNLSAIFRFAAATRRADRNVTAREALPGPKPRSKILSAGRSGQAGATDERARSSGPAAPRPRVPEGIPPPRPDKAAMRAALDALFDPDEVVELRAFSKEGRKGVTAGYFDGEHRDALVNEAARLNAAGAAVYVTLNEIDPQILRRCCNRVQDYAKATVTDKDVIRRRWLLIDFDPVGRPTRRRLTRK